jgi:hypothetical protein
MIMKRFITSALFTVAAALSLAMATGLVHPTSAFAATDTCASTEKAITVSGVDNAVMCCPKNATDRTSCLVLKYVDPAVKLLAALAGIAVVAGIMIAGMQYASSQGDPQKTAAAKGRITKSLTALFVFFFLYSMLQFLSPGGLSTNTAPVKGPPSAENCAKDFFGLKPWFAYLPKESFDANCQVDNFRLLSDDSGDSMLPSVALAILDDILRVTALVAVAYVIIGGIKYTTSQGEPENTKKARETIVNALIGLVIAIVAASIVSFIGSKIT